MEHTYRSHPNYVVRNRESVVLKPVFVETIPHLPEMEERHTLRQHEVCYPFPSMPMRMWSFGRRDAGPCDS